MSNTSKIALGMSGGVDSSTSAAYLMNQGFEVIGVTCLFQNDDNAHQAACDAAEVCARLGIKHVVSDCTDLFCSSVVDYFIDGYACGKTPSPCVFCNALCKIPSLLDVADELGCEKIATGHYARIAQLESNGRFVVKTALDATKDQSYMLSFLSQEHLSRLILPLGGTTKTAVRKSADDLKLSVADKPDSQDICFIQGDHVDFLVDHGVTSLEGNIVTSDGKIVGKHQGLFRYTLGQRKGIGVGGASEPYYVIAKKPDTNELVVGFKDESFIREVMVDSLVWQSFEELTEPLDCMVKLRYRSQAVACKLVPKKNKAIVHLVSPRLSTAPGQIAVFYQGETVLAGGVIT